jgi:hypothetical protein
MSLEIVDTFAPYYSGRQPLVPRQERKRLVTEGKDPVTCEGADTAKPETGSETRQ